MIKIRLKNRSYGFVYSENLPDKGFSEIKIPVIPQRAAVTGDYSDIADNHCACICAMNMILVLRKFRIGRTMKHPSFKDRESLFREIHRIIGNGPVVFLKPKINRILKSTGSSIKLRPVTEYADIEKCIREHRPVAMLVNAGITLWHWVLVIGVRKYIDGSIYLNILDGWNKRSDRYLKYSGRESFIRALGPVMAG